jgi:putative salt-induced outer membrane protein YdiY
MLICFLSASPCWAQNVILHLHSGDRISGQLISETAESVLMKTAFAESLPVEKTLIERREEVTPEPTPAEVEAPPPKPAPPAEAPPAPPAAPPASTAPVQAAAPPPPDPSAFRKFISEWRGEIRMGANFGFGTKNRETFTGHMKATHNKPFPGTARALRNITEYNVWYGSTDGTLSDNRMDGRLTTEYDLSKRFLVYSAAGAGYDKIRRIDFEYNLGPGLGYKWLTRTNFVLKTELGAHYHEQIFETRGSVTRYSLRIAEDSWWQVSTRLRLDQKVEFYPGVEDFSNYRIRAEGNLRYLLKENITLSLNVINTYDTSAPPTVSRNDLQVRSLIGLKF